MPLPRLLALIAALLSMVMACAPAPASRPSDSAGASEEASPPAPQRVVTIVVRVEPPQFNDRLDRMGMGFPVSVTLAYLDTQLNPQPMLAERLPTQDDGSWTVNADGTMKTTYHLRPDLKWHDGHALTAEDFRFAYQVYTDRDVPMTTRLPETLMSDVAAPDDRTLEIIWKETYVDANALTVNQLSPLPRHLLQDLYDQDKTAFLNSTFWTSPDFVGNGPYRVSQWEHGVRIALAANPYFVFGKPGIDSIEYRFITDANTIVAGFFAGSIDYAEYTAVDAEQAVILSQRWNQDHGGQVFSDTLFGTRYIEFQHRDVPNHQAAIEDARIRRGLMFALDREALTEAMQHGYGSVADTGFPKTAPLYPRIAQVISTYPHDPRRSDQAFGEAGWSRGPDGLYHDAAGRSLDLEVRVTGEREQEGTIIAADWKRAGVDSHSYVVPRALTTDVEFRVNFPGVAVSAATDLLTSANVLTDQAPTAANRFTGKNRGSYSNPEIDRRYAQSLLTLNVADRDGLILEMEKIFSEDVAQGLLYYQPRIGAARSDIRGVKPPVQGPIVWNLWEWTLGA